MKQIIERNSEGYRIYEYPHEDTDGLPIHFRRTVFLDRDGVINRRRTDYVKSVDEFQFLPGAIDAIQQLAVNGTRICVITNQSSIDRGIVPIETVEAVHLEMLAALRKSGASIHALALCPHRPDENCRCRKPNPTLLLALAEKYNLDIVDIWFVGDNTTDALAGFQAGVRMLMVEGGPFSMPDLVERWGRTLPESGLPVFPSLQDAARHILTQPVS